MKKFEKIVRTVYRTANDAAYTVKRVVEEEREKAEEKRLEEERRAEEARQAELRRKREKLRKNRVKYIALLALGIIFTVSFSICMINEEENAESEEQERTELEAQNEEEAEAVKEETESFLNELIGSTLQNAIPKLEEKKYDATYLVNVPENEDTELIESLHDDELDDWIVDRIEEYDTEEKTVSILVKSAETVKDEREQEALQKKFPSQDAAYALEHYGEYLYPYGFELHSFTGIISKYAVDENTWFIKAEVTITNAYGTEMDTVCEAEVSGNKSNPEISNFYVY